MPSQINSLGQKSETFLCLTKIVTLKPSYDNRFSQYEGDFFIKRI